MGQRKLDRYKRKAGDALDQKDMQSFGHRTDKLQQEHDKLGLAYDTQTELFLAQRDSLRNNIVDDVINRQYAKSEGYVEKTRRGVRRRSQAEYSDNYSSTHTQRTRTRTRRPHTRRISRDEETLNQTAKRKVNERTNTDSLDPQGRNIVRGGGNLLLKAVNAGLAIGSIWKMAKGAWGLVFGEKGTAKEHAKEFAIGAALGGAYLGMNHVKRGKAWKNRTGDEVESIDDIPDQETKEAAQHQIEYPLAVNNALSGIPFVVLKKYINYNTNGTVKTIRLQELYKDAQDGRLPSAVTFKDADMKKLIKLEKDKGIISEVFANAGLTRNIILAHEDHYAKNSTYYWINKYGQNLEDREQQETFTDPFGYMPKLVSSPLDKQTKQDLISEVSKIRNTTGTKINLTVKAGGIMMEQAGHTILLDLDQYAKTYTTIINGKRYPMIKEFTDTKDLVRLAQHEMRVLEHFKTKKTYTQTPFSISGDSIIFDQAPFQRTSSGSYFNRDSLTAYGDGVLGFGAAHEKIDALDNDNYLRYYRDRLNDFDWQTNVETDPNQIDIHNIGFVTSLVTSLQGLKGKVDGITTIELDDGTKASVFTINGAAQTVEKTWELVKEGSPGARTGKRAGKAFRFIENTAIDVVSGAAIALGNNLTSMYEAASEELSDSQILNFAKDLATKVGKKATDIKEATIEGGNMIITTVSGTTHKAIDYFREGKIGHAIGYGVIESLQFVGNGLVTVVTEGGGFVVRSTKQFFEGISEAWGN